MLVSITYVGEYNICIGKYNMCAGEYNICW